MNLIVRLYKNNYALLSLLPFLSAITAILTFLVIQSGWEKSNIYTKAFFILFATITALTNIYPTVYQQTESIEKNMNNYLGYNLLQKDIFHYSIIQPGINGDSCKFIQFLDSLNLKEAKLSKIYFDLSQESVDDNFLNGINQ